MADPGGRPTGRRHRNALRRRICGSGAAGREQRDEGVDVVKVDDAEGLDEVGERVGDEYMIEK